MSDSLHHPWTDGVAAVLFLTGLLLAAHGVRRCGRAFPRPRSASMQPLTWMRGFRLTLFGLGLAGTGAGWLWSLEWLIALSLAVGGEEVLESSIAIYALRAQPRIRSRGVSDPRASPLREAAAVGAGLPHRLSGEATPI